MEKNTWCLHCPLKVIFLIRFNSFYTKICGANCKVLIIEMSK